MIEESLQWAAQMMGGSGDPLAPVGEFHGVCTDTRKLKPGQLFFCLLGNRDGHEFAASAIKQGASAIVIDKAHSVSDPQLKSLPHIMVKDTLFALGELAKSWREKFNIPIVALTGSNGKTTTKELLKAILDEDFETLATQGNFNNLIGVPKTLFRLEARHEIAVIEMGMNDYGEIHRLTQIVQPTVALITNIGQAHLEKLGDLTGVALAKGELFAELSEDALAFYNMKDPYIKKMTTRARRFLLGTPETKHWGELLPSDPHAPLPQQVKIHWDDKTHSLPLPLPGQHQLDNLVLAIGVGRHFGVSWVKIKRALKSLRPTASRMELLKTKQDKWIIDDSYNANPTSTAAALQAFAQLKGELPGMAILGDMNELGPASQRGHQEIGAKLGEAGIEFLIAIGQYAKETQAGALSSGIIPDHIRVFSNTDSFLDQGAPIFPDVKWILVKGSRTNHLEKVVSTLKENE